MGEYVIRSKKVFKELSSIKEEIKQLLIDGAKNEDVIEKYVPIIVEKFGDYKESYLINDRNIGYFEIPNQKTTVIEVFKSGMKIKNPNPNNYLFDQYMPFDKGNEVCEVIAKKLKSIGFFSGENIIEKAKSEDEVLKKFIENRLYNELVKVGNSSRVKELFKEVGDIDNLVTVENIDYIYKLDLIDIIDLKKVYNNGNTLLDIINNKFIKYEYLKIEKPSSFQEEDPDEDYKQYITKRNELLELGAETKYEIIYGEAKNGKSTLANRLLKGSLQGIYGFDNNINGDKLAEIYYILITLLQLESSEVVKRIMDRVNQVIFNGVFNAEFKGIKFLDYFFTDEKYPCIREGGFLSIGDPSYRLGFQAFNEIQLPRLKEPFSYNFDFIFSNTKKVDDHVIKFLIGNENLKRFIFSYFESIGFDKTMKEYYTIPETKEYFKNSFFYEDKERKRFIIRKDILERTIYSNYISDGEIKCWFIEAFEKLDNLEKLKFLLHKDYCGRNTLHYAFLKEDVEMLEVISKLYDNKTNQKELDRLAKEADYFNRLPGEYNKIEGLEINKKLVLGEGGKARGSFSFLYGPSILDIIDIMVSEKGANYKGEVIVGNDVYSEIDSRLKYYKEKEIKINDRYINFKRLLEYTDNINISKEKSIKRSLRTTFKDESYKFIHVLQRLGYSIVKVKSKSNVILKKFEGLEERPDKLYEIKEIILTNLMVSLGNILYYDDEDILRVYHEESQERTRREKANAEPPLNSLKFIGQSQLSQIIDYSRNQFLGYENEDEVYKNFEIVDKLTEVLYGERVLTLFKNLKDLCDSYKNIEPENVIWEFLESNEEVEIDHSSKVVRVGSRDSVKKEYQYYLKGKGYEIEIM